MHQLIQIVLLPRLKLQSRWPDSKWCLWSRKWGSNNRYPHAEGWTTPIKNQNWNGWQYLLFTLSVAHRKLMKTYVFFDNIYNSWTILKGSKTLFWSCWSAMDLQGQTRVAFGLIRLWKLEARKVLTFDPTRSNSKIRWLLLFDQTLRLTRPSAPVLSSPQGLSRDTPDGSRSWVTPSITTMDQMALFWGWGRGRGPFSAKIEFS